MKNLIFIFTILFCYRANGQFEYIKQRDLGQNNIEKFKTLSLCTAELSSEFKKWNIAPNIWLDIGVLKVSYYIDRDFNETWRVKVILDDEYKYNYPDSYTFASNDQLVLFYEADSLGNEVKKEVKSELLKEWIELLSNRVYKKNTDYNYRYVKYYDKNTNKDIVIKAYYLPEDEIKNYNGYQWRKMTILGNPFNEIYIKFDKNGKLISKKKSV